LVSGCSGWSPAAWSWNRTRPRCGWCWRPGTALLVEALTDAGFTVLPVNPDLVARRRGPAKKKDDSEDARICCLMALDAYLDLRRLIPHGETGTELRAIARDDERAARDDERAARDEFNQGG
jgi:hypothetical protein